jgi:hypothetical protein
MSRISACIETKLMQYLSSVCSVTMHLHVSGLSVVHHQEVTMCICDNLYVLYVLVNCQWACQQSTKTYNTFQLSHIYIYIFPSNTDLLFSHEMAVATRGPFQMLRSLCVIDRNFMILRHLLLKLWRNEIL